jgi:putative NADH-flavin reductase
MQVVEVEEQDLLQAQEVLEDLAEEDLVVQVHHLHLEQEQQEQQELSIQVAEVEQAELVDQMDLAEPAVRES